MQIFIIIIIGFIIIIIIVLRLINVIIRPEIFEIKLKSN